MEEAPHELNRRSWNAVTPAHQSHKSDQAKFLSRGGSTLFDEERDLLGDLDGRNVLHVQCNCGQDTLSIASEGATVVGVDISDAAIEEARALARDSGIAAEFEREEIVTWLGAAARSGRRFDIAFASYGAEPWIEDLAGWMRGIAGVLVPGGRLVLLEFHPAAWSVDAHGRVVESYFLDGPIRESGGVRDYVARSGDGLTPMGRRPGIADFENPEPAVSFQRTVAQIVQTAIDAGLGIEILREYPYANGAALLEGMRAISDRRYVRAEGVPDLPLMLGMVARKPA
jgi:SAM-dependent methyltransferase